MYPWSPYTMIYGEVIQKYTGKLCSVFTRILSESGKMRCKKTPHSRWFYVV